jgi:hypothetical protein
MCIFRSFDQSDRITVTGTPGIETAKDPLAGVRANFRGRYVVDVSTTYGKEPAFVLEKLALRGGGLAHMLAKNYGSIISCKTNTHMSK